MTAEPSPRVLAYAIAELGGVQIRAAVQYLDDWEAGLRYGVPVADLRHALDRKSISTDARRAVSHWHRDGERGLLALVGGYGIGKTYAAVRWVLARHHKGRPSMWWLASRWPIAFADQDRLLSQLGRSSALVIDDLGDGESQIKTMSADARSKIIAKLADRIAEGRPTVLISNAEGSEIEAWLGGRMIDRLRFGGGIARLKPADSLRDDSEERPDKLGRSKQWHAAQRIAELVGVERDGDELRFGRLLELSPERCGEAVRLLGLDRAEVITRAREILDSERGVIEAVAAETGIDLPIRELTWGELAPHIHSHIATGAERQAEAEARRRADLEAQRMAIAKAIEAEGPVDIEPHENPPLGLVERTRKLAKPYGLRAVVGDIGGYDVLVGATKIASGSWSEAQAWWVVAEILRPHLAPRLAVVGGDS